MHSFLEQQTSKGREICSCQFSFFLFCFTFLHEQCLHIIASQCWLSSTSAWALPRDSSSSSILVVSLIQTAESQWYYHHHHRIVGVCRDSHCKLLFYKQFIKWKNLTSYFPSLYQGQKKISQLIKENELSYNVSITYLKCQRQKLFWISVFWNICICLREFLRDRPESEQEIHLCLIDLVPRQPYEN